jgi:hypothetical protein
MDLKRKKRLQKDLVIIIVSIIIGFILLKTGVIKHVLVQSVELEYVGIFFAGILFTSVFTTVPATIVLGEMALTTNIWALALVGGLGALLGDFVLFRFFRDTIAEDLESLFTFQKTKRWKYIFKSHVFKVFLSLVGGIIIASPLPDELGLAFMGISKTNNWSFTVISFLCNAVGILVIGLLAKSIS